jgi:large subunit ribosomal protein L32
MRLRTRKAANRWHAPLIHKCGQCGAAYLPHCVCRSCGYYKGRQVLTIEAV